MLLYFFTNELGNVILYSSFCFVTSNRIRYMHTLNHTYIHVINLLLVVTES